MTMSGSSSLTKMHLEEAIKALEEAASIHLKGAHQAISTISIQAKQEFEAGMKALSNGDSNSAVMHLKAPDMKLVGESLYLKFTSKFFCSSFENNSILCYQL